MADHKSSVMTLFKRVSTSHLHDLGATLDHYQFFEPPLHLSIRRTSLGDARILIFFVFGVLGGDAARATRAEETKSSRGAPYMSIYRFIQLYLQFASQTRFLVETYHVIRTDLNRQ